MNDWDNKIALYHQAPLKVLSFLSLYPGEVFSTTDISEKVGVSKAALKKILPLLCDLDILSREQKGNVFLYSLNSNNIVLRQFKIFENILNLQQLVKEIQPYCYKIVLFGSQAQGTNAKASDIDLFIRSEYKDQIQKIIFKYETEDIKIQAVIRDPLESVSEEKENQPFFQQVKKGITLWEGKPTYDEI